MFFRCQYFDELIYCDCTRACNNILTDSSITRISIERKGCDRALANLSFTSESLRWKKLLQKGTHSLTFSTVQFISIEGIT